LLSAKSGNLFLIQSTGLLRPVFHSFFKSKPPHVKFNAI
jgi:hypothetical protein